MGVIMIVKIDAEKKVMMLRDVPYGESFELNQDIYTKLIRNDYEKLIRSHVMEGDHVYVAVNHGTKTIQLLGADVKVTMVHGELDWWYDEKEKL